MHDEGRNTASTKSAAETVGNAALLPGSIPASIGPYRILEVLGEGGFGIVYLAERREPMVQRVAVKVIKPGMDSKAVLARFEAERQALALMDHPNIARVFDAGATPEGRPYFVMEHVPGIPITEHCDKERLTIRQRLELFAVVCDGVAHAHMKGIIHRDIKPSNILVSVRETGEGVPKIIDFGVAKATQMRLTEQTVFTEQGVLIGTPEYMSPEQAEMNAQDIDTRSDVYSLGVVLYELLTGAVPFDSASLRAKGYQEIRRVIREVEPPRPSTRLTAQANSGTATAEARRALPVELARQLRSELEWVPLKALRKDRTERYRSAQELGDEIRAYLGGEPLIAGPDSAAYRFLKLVRRHKGPVAAVASVVLVLLAGVTATSIGFATAARRAEDARLAKVDADKKTAIAEEQTAKANAAKDTIEYNSYVANVQMAAAAMDFRQFDRVRQRLDACPERLRGWEWRWINAQSDSSLAELKGHTEDVESAAFSPDGTRIVTASFDNTARVWDAATGIALAELKGHTDLVNSAAFSPDGRRIVTASFDNTARVWDAATGASVAELKGHTGVVLSAVFSPDGTRILTASEDHTARVWDAATGAPQAELKGHTNSVGSGAFSPDGTRIVTTSWDKTARVWDAAMSVTQAELRWSSDELLSVAVGAGGTRAVTGYSGMTARVWDAGTGVVLAELKGHTSGVLSAAFSPDGTRIVTASLDKTARIWDAATGLHLAQLHGHTGEVESAAFSPDGTRIVTASRDKTARVWDAATGVTLTELKGHRSEILSAEFSPDGARIVTASRDKTARVWDAVTGVTLTELKGHTLQVMSGAFSPDGTRVVTASWDKTARVWDAATGVILTELKGHAGAVVSAAFSPDGTRIVTASGDKTARVWDAVTRVILAELKGHASLVFSAAFSSDGTRIVTASRDETARVWDSVPYRERYKDLRAPALRK